MISKKILASVFIIGLLAFAMGWGTYSYFSDTETSTGNKFKAGTLNLRVGGNDPTTWSVTISNIKPGDNGTIEVPFTVEGTMKGYVDVKITNIENSGGSTPEPEPTPDNGELGSKLLVTAIQMNSWKMKWSTPKSFNYLNDKWWWKDGLLGAFPVDGLTYTPPYTDSIKIFWELPETVGNKVQGDILTFDIEFTLTQGTSGIEVH